MPWILADEIIFIVSYQTMKWRCYHRDEQTNNNEQKVKTELVSYSTQGLRDT